MEGLPPLVLKFIGIKNVSNIQVLHGRRQLVS